MADPTPIDPRRLKKLLRRLIDLYSPSGKEEEIQDFLFGYLKRHGLPVERQEVDEHRDNLIVDLGGDGRKLGLVGHVDTVAAHDLERYESDEEGDRIVGLGSADMKAGVAAMVEALVACHAAGGRPPVALCLVVGEEEDGDGAAELMVDYQFPWAIIGEPTDLAVCPGSYSYLEVQLAAAGQRRHASLAKRGKSPVETLLKLTIALTRFLEEKRPEVIYNVRDLWSGQSGFAVPEGCEAWLDLHLPPSAPVAELVSELEELVKAEAKPGADVTTSIRFATIDAGFQLPDKGPVLDALREIYARRGLPFAPAPFPSHSDAGRLWEAGARPVILGPGRLESAHSPDESVAFSQTLLAAQVYYDLIQAVKA